MLGYPKSTKTLWTWHILPYLEQDNLYRAIDLKEGLGPNWQAVNGPVFATVVPVYQCPSDAGGVSAVLGGRALSNYVGCWSPDGTLAERTIGPADVFNDVNGSAANAAKNPATRTALFNYNVRRSIGSVTDGLSGTAIASEVIGGDYRGSWSHDQGMAYTHHVTPNSTTPDAQWTMGGCISRKNAPCDGRATAWGLADIAARSNHTGGVNVLLGDGSVRFAADGISLTTWQALASINAGEVVGADW